MPSCPHKYNRIDDALRSRNHTFFRGEGLSYVDTSECYGYLYKTIRCIVKVLKKMFNSCPIIEAMFAIQFYKMSTFIDE